MGTIIRFPEPRQIVRDGQPQPQTEAAVIIILPAIRIERGAEPSSGLTPERNAPGRKPRRPTSHS